MYSMKSIKINLTIFFTVESSRKCLGGNHENRLVIFFFWKLRFDHTGFSITIRMNRINRGILQESGVHNIRISNLSSAHAFYLKKLKLKLIF